MKRRRDVMSRMLRTGFVWSVVAVSVVALSTPPGAAAAQPVEMTQTPYGLVPSAKVVTVRSNEAVSEVDGRLVKIDRATRETVADLGPARDDLDRVDPRAYAASLRGEGVADVGTLAADKTVDGHCPQASATNIKSFSTTWTVPSEAEGDETVFYWNGIDSGRLQPVLKWDGDFSVVNWALVDGRYITGGEHSVDSGDDVTGKVTLDSSGDGLWNYTVAFRGYRGIDLHVERDTVADNVIECVESYGDSNDYPSEGFITMRDIHLTSTAGHTTPARLNWRDSVNNDNGYCVIVSNSSSDGEMDIYFED